MILSFPASLTENLTLVYEWLKDYTNMAIEIGGGTVLAARWQHRLSTDIDLFYNTQDEREIFNSGTKDEWLDHLTEQQKRGNVHSWNHYFDGDSWYTEYGPVSLFRTVKDDVKLGKAVDIERETGILCQTTSNILFNKIQGRIIHDYQYTARDLYDIACAYVFEKENLNRSISALANYSVEGLKRDLAGGYIKINDFDTLLEVKYEKFASSADILEKLAGQILTNTIDAEAMQIINEVRESI